MIFYSIRRRDVTAPLPRQMYIEYVIPCTMSGEEAAHALLVIKNFLKKSGNSLDEYTERCYNDNKEVHRLT